LAVAGYRHISDIVKNPAGNQLSGLLYHAIFLQQKFKTHAIQISGRTNFKINILLNKDGFEMMKNFVHNNKMV